MVRCIIQWMCLIIFLPLLRILITLFFKLLMRGQLLELIWASAMAALKSQEFQKTGRRSMIYPITEAPKYMNFFQYSLLKYQLRFQCIFSKIGGSFACVIKFDICRNGSHWSSPSSVFQNLERWNFWTILKKTLFTLKGWSRDGWGPRLLVWQLLWFWSWGKRKN